MGVKSFHLCIKEAIDKIDHDLVNLKLAKAVFKHNPEKLTYGSQAFLIAAYVSGLFTKENQHEIKTEVVKKIVKTSNNVPMK